jgi:hypothetical protein
MAAVATDILNSAVGPPYSEGAARRNPIAVSADSALQIRHPPALTNW